jgi:hypothetical protein
MGTGPKTQSILYNNHYGWFERRGRGLYGLKPKALPETEGYPEIVAAYRRAISKKPALGGPPMGGHPKQS